MPLCTLHLIRLSKEGELGSSDARCASFLKLLLASDLGPRLLVASLVRRPVILAERIDSVYLNATPWDLLLVFGPDAKGPSVQASSIETKATPLSLEDDSRTRAHVDVEYVLDVGVPTRILSGYKGRTKELVEAAARAKKPSLDSLRTEEPARTHAGRVPKTSQNLEMSDELLDLIEALEKLGDSGLVNGGGPVHQLNLLKFKPTKEDRDRYLEYGRGFAKAAEAHGGDAKLLGVVVADQTRAALQQQGSAKPSGKLQWDEISLVHYHSLRDFAAMAASEAYQSINRDKRLPSLLDTTIICTQEVDLDRLRRTAKL
ncbi:hypothetical protein FA10DRAFT_264202 [Acaromyces ingoldii]|uniref:Uncharacterized protein n=1 Tax=Acaromyces ingoldii TaxID=215250 RepID=A0A316YVU2_9BASI|nr:hypothetical protein FA10DRAFT_264202 [Acaromyces ingoldii]PWN93567.1 hypothetical protein FA10DRAFT_264202 [Acaromyces ingoldii]